TFFLSCYRAFFVLHSSPTRRSSDLRTGTFSVNSYSADFNSPFGGFKESGIGREHGVAGLEGYLIPKTISVDPSMSIPESVVEQRSEEHTSELQSRFDLVCRLLLEK